MKQRIGRLTFAGPVGNELIKASCACGFPSVIVTAQDWDKGTVLGCPACHVAEVKARTEEAAKEAQERAAEQKEAARVARAKACYILPAVHELDSRQRKLLKTLSERASFTVTSVAKLLQVTPEEAWSEMIGLLQANALLEHDVLGATRPYSQDEPYEARAQRHNSYSVRRLALRQLHQIEEAEEKPAPPEPRVSDAVMAEVRSFISERCAVSPDAYISPIELRSRYCEWAEASQRELIRVADFEAALDVLGYAVRGGRRRGVRLLRSSELASATTV